MEHGAKKAKGQILVKLVWIVGAIFTAILTVGAVIDFQNGINGDSVSACVKTVLYLAAFVIGLIYLFQPGKEKFATAAAFVYAAAAVLGFAAAVCGGSRYAALDMVHMVVNVLVFIVFGIVTAVFLKGGESGAFSVCAKLWWLPSAVSVVIAIVESISTELNDSRGFDPALVAMDVIVAVILLLPMFLMTLTVKNRAERR